MWKVFARIGIAILVFVLLILAALVPITDYSKESNFGLLVI